MSSRKRPASHGDDEDESASTSPSSPADSSPQQGSEGRKRRRITNNSDTTPEQSDNGDDANNEISDDDEATDEEEMAMCETFHTQQILEKKTRLQDTNDTAEESGILTEVVIHDFMCHHHFTFTLGPNINFICGRNGSGKSAILTAIIICFGGRADKTNRGGKIKDLIKHGAEKAYVQCTLKNEGLQAYQPEVYGDTITIERHFTKSGTGGYKLYGETRRSVISTKKADLEAIIDHFSLQTENTLNVLDQDAARAFISSSDAGEKYKLFVKGVQLERLDQDYTLLSDRLAEMKPKLALKSEDVATLQKAVHEKVEMRKQLQKQEKLSDHIRDLVRQAFWAQVREAEATVAEMDKDVVEAQSQIQTLQTQVEHIDAQYQQANELYELKAAMEVEAKAQLEGTKDEHREEKNALDEAKKDAASAKLEQQNAGEAVKAVEKQIRKATDDISVEEQRLLELNGGGAARRRHDLDQAQLALRQAQDAVAAHRETEKDIEALRKAARAKEMAAKAESQRFGDMVRDQRSKLRDLKQRGAQNNAGFRPNTDKLESAIQRETRWQHRPIGPCGKYIRLLKPQWASIIEVTLGRGLSDFLVFSKQDADLLDQLKRQVRCDAGVTVVNKLRIVPRVPEVDCDTILNVLEFDNEDVKKSFIISNYIEQMLLVADQTKATSTMYDNGRLRSVRGCFAIDPNDRRCGVYLKYGPGGEQSQDPVAAYTRPPRLKSDYEATLAAKEELLQTTEAETAAANAAWQATRIELTKVDKQVKTYGTTLKDLTKEAQEAADMISSLEDAIAEDNVESGKLDSLKQLLSEAEEQKGLLVSQFNDAVVEADSKQKVVRNHRRRVDEIEQRQKSFQDAIAQAESTLRHVEQNRQKILRNKNNEIARVKDAEVRLVRRQEDQAAARDALNVVTEQAREKSERVNVPEDQTAQSIADRVTRLRKERSAFQRRMGMTLEEAMNAETAVKTAFKQSKDDYRELTEVRDQLVSSLKERRLRWKKFRQHITVRAKIIFSRLLGERGFRGELLMNHDTHALDLRVEPDISRKNGEGRTAKTLSGGEKSFSQICLLLAMWEAMGSPIRCLDEFDVFMDAVNRNISVKLITEAARTQARMQYILISPGSKADFVRAPDVTVMDLGDPRTREEAGQQRTLGESGFNTGQRT